MGELFQPTHIMILMVLLFFFPIIVVPYWFIFKKAGFPPAISLLMFFPLLNLLILYIVAFSRWKVVPAEQIPQHQYSYPPAPQM
ncbi:MAG: hypothetical protein JSS87_05285 [Acidobacteria bacterium]|nr:hypothetical protein [Acidobacteriota bacterium]